MELKKEVAVPIVEDELNILNRKKQIVNVIKQLRNLNKTLVEYDLKDDKLNHIYVSNGNKFVPDFGLVWCSVKNHYRGYIYLASKNENVKSRDNHYCICVIRSPLDAVEFVNTYLFFYRHRGNNRSLD